MKEFKNIALRTVLMDIVTIENEVGALIGLNVKFKENGINNIYRTSTGEVVKGLPRNLTVKGIDLDLSSVVELNSLFINTISTYLFNIRKTLNKGEIDLYIKSKLDEEISLRANVTRHFLREKMKGRDKVSISFIENSIFGEFESVMLRFTKKDIQILHAIFTEIISRYYRCKSLTSIGDKFNYKDNTIDSEAYISITKVDSSIVIDNIWLHGQELSNLLYVVDKLIYGFNIEKDLEVLNMSFRQMFISSENGITYLNLRKMSKEHKILNEEELDEMDEYEDKQRRFDIKITFNSFLLSILDLYLSIDILRHADMESELDSSIEILGSQSPFKSGLGVRYHISLKESSLGFAFMKKMNNKGEERNVLSLLGKVKEGAFNYENEDGIAIGAVYKNKKDDTLKDVLVEFNIDMTGSWLKLIKALSLAYTKEYIVKEDLENKIEEKNHSLTRFSVTNINSQGKFKYVFNVLSNVGNKAAAVLTIDKYQVKNREEVFISGYRQPLFERYVFQMLIMILSLSSFIDDIVFFEEKNKKDIMPYKYKSMVSFTKINKNEKVDYGLKKIDGIAYWGIHSNNNNMFVELTEQDQFILNKSAFFRLFRGYWLPFVGLNIGIGQDKYLTDMFAELNLEEDSSDDGIKWATKLFIGTMDKKI